MSDWTEIIEDVVSTANKRFGELAVFRLGSSDYAHVETVKSGVPPLDVALGVGGIPRGRIIEFYGGESSGKTTLALQAIACFQKIGILAGFIDVEHSLDKAWAERLGVDIDNLLFSQPDCGEDALEVAEIMVSRKVGLVVIDSVAALVPKAELEGEMGEAHVGLQARLMSQAMRKLAAKSKKSNTSLIFINQTRSKIGVMYGNPETTPGGNALKFYSSVRLSMNKLSPKEEDKEDGKVISQNVRIRVVKNKLAAPHAVCDAKLIFKDDAAGFDLAHNIFASMLDTNVIDKSGNTYSLNGEKIAVGKAKAIAYIADLDEDELTKYYIEVLLRLDKAYVSLEKEIGEIEELIEKCSKEKRKDKLLKQLEELRFSQDKIRAKYG